LFEARGNVEDWLGKVEEAMVVNLRKMSKSAIADFHQRKREEWCVAHPSQVTCHACLNIKKITFASSFHSLVLWLFVATKDIFAV